MIKDTISEDMVNLLLRQMGAVSIKTSPAYINIVKFEIGSDVKITYLYETKEDEIYLQRVCPYPMMIGKLYNEQQIVDFIDLDLRKFRSAHESSNFNQFVDTAKSILSMNAEVENLFLFHNVDKDALKQIDEEVTRLRELVNRVSKESPVLEEK